MQTIHMLNVENTLSAREVFEILRAIIKCVVRKRSYKRLEDKELYTYFNVSVTITGNWPVYTGSDLFPKTTPIHIKITY